MFNAAARDQALAALHRLTNAAASAPLPYAQHQANMEAAQLIHNVLTANPAAAPAAPAAEGVPQ